MKLYSQCINTVHVFLLLLSFSRATFQNRKIGIKLDLGMFVDVLAKKHDKADLYYSLLVRYLTYGMKRNKAGILVYTFSTLLNTLLEYVDKLKL